MFKINKIIPISLLVISSTAYSQDTKQELTYVKLPQQTFEFKTKNQNEKAQVLYFFNYGCPYCYQSDRYIDIYKKYIKNKNISFHYQPIEVNEAWKEYSKSFYIAEALNLDIHKDMYYHTQVLNKKIFNENQLFDYFNSNYEISNSEFSMAYKSPLSKYKLKNNEKRADKFKVVSTPTVVIIAENQDVYKFSPSINNGILEMVNSMVLATEEIINNNSQEKHINEN